MKNMILNINLRHKYISKSKLDLNLSVIQKVLSKSNARLQDIQKKGTEHERSFFLEPKIGIYECSSR